MTQPVVTPISGKPNLLLGAFDITDVGYTASEYFVSGSAASYSPVGDCGSDGVWDAEPSGAADYTTRMVVLTPTDTALFNGTVLVEWLNVSGGIDAPALWFMAHREILREGYAYVAVSAQYVGVEGGESLGGANMSLKTLDPDRYGGLHHPGDAFSYDIFSQIGELFRPADNVEVLAGLSPDAVVAVGESQSAMFLTTYLNAVDPLAQVFNGFLVHSRFGPAAPLDGASILESQDLPPQVRFRPHLRVPTVAVITETDLIDGRLAGYHAARQPDNEMLRTWEIPGAAHADNYTIRVAFIDTGAAPVHELVAAYAPTDVLMGQQLAHFINFGPQHHYVLQAALAGLSRWLRTGEPAPSAEPIALTATAPPALNVDVNGLAIGGVRTPWVDVPIARTSGIADSDDVEMAFLFGTGAPFDDATLDRLYPGGVTDYLDRFTRSLDAAIAAGFLVPTDRAEILDLAAATYPG
ncbi:MAG: alpha/beta hydrolase domain-containing protein [Mycobacterium sp.]